jgi:hypothetical protein
MKKIEVREQVAGLSRTMIAAIGALTAQLEVAGHEELSNAIVNTLDRYEEEIIRLQAANSKLRTKNRNYRTGMKSLQKAHEASLYREQATKESIAQLKQLIQDGAVCGVSTVDDDSNAPYTPVRFNNDMAYARP